MSSPPYTATSPSYPSPTSLPTTKKRPANTNASLPASKRRKSSIATNASSRHPLRQTSFPPEGSNGHLARSPSVESSLGGGGSVSVARSRKGKKGDARSVVSGSIRGKGGAASTKAEVERASPVEDDEDDEDDDGGVVNEEMGIDDQQAKEREKILISHFTPEQQNRWEVWMRVKPSVKIVKTIANKALNQSIPGKVAVALNGMTKTYAGTIIERARDVQAQWMAAESPDGRVDEKNRGPLLPDHLREAVRRHKKDVEGGNAGQKALSLVATETYASRTGGKRIFR